MPRKSIHEARYRRFLDRLRKAREDAGLDQIEVSRRLKQAPNYCTRIESGARWLPVLHLADLARIYGKPLRFFLPDTPPEQG